DSGLVDTDSGQKILLSTDVDGNIEGRTETDGDLVFEISVDAATGDVTVAQFRAIKHDQPLDDDEASDPEIMDSGLVELQVTVTDGDGDTSSDSIELGDLIKFEDDGPVINSFVDAIIVNQPVQVVKGTYDADFGTDGLGLLSLALGDAATDFSYGTPIDLGDGLTQINVVVTGGEDFTFYYTTTDSSTSALFEAFLDQAMTEPFFTLTVNDDGTYVFTLLDNSILTDTTLIFSPSNAGSPVEVLVLEGVTITARDAANAPELVNPSAQGLATGTNQNIEEGESVILNFDALQKEVSFSLQKWGGTGQFATVTLIFFAADGTTELGRETIEVAKPTSSVLVEIEQGTDAPSGSTVFVNFDFDTLQILYVDHTGMEAETEGNLTFNINNITFGLETVVEDFTVLFDLTATDGDGDFDTLENGLSVTLDGNDVTAGLILTGTSDGEILMGGTGPDTLNGLGGDDILIGGDGADKLFGGADNDTLVFDSIDTVIDGGTGEDTLQVAVDSDDDINLTTFSAGATLTGIEVIDLESDTSGNTLTLEAADLLQSDTDTLTVLGDSGDAVVAGTGWGASIGTGTVNGVAVDIFTQTVGSLVTLNLDQDITNVTIS
ncbi:MAG: hypothetical protein IH904_08285, partial [Proteobacteria bacterium]|nr:hypothetical protein [Pseudomonadota bacterium]